jgi:hypothetical protein
LYNSLSLFFFSPRVQFLGFFMQPRPTGVSRAGLIFCSTFVSRQKWKKPPQKVTSNWGKSENLKYALYRIQHPVKFYNATKMFLGTLTTIYV